MLEITQTSNIKPSAEYYLFLSTLKNNFFFVRLKNVIVYVCLLLINKEKPTILNHLIRQIDRI